MPFTVTDMLEIFQYDFMIRAFVAGIIIAIIAPLIGMFLVVRRYSLMADTLAHVSLMGVAIGLLSNIHPPLMALAVSAVAALGIERLRQTGRLFGESVLAIFLSGGLAIAVVLMSFAHGVNANLLSYLFGSITTVSLRDLITIGGIGIAVLATVVLLYKEFFFVSFNEELAEANGLNTRLLNNILVVLAAITVALAIRLIGVLLIGALMVIPVVTAMQYGYGFLKTLMLAIAFGITSVVIGLFLSFYLDLTSGGTIVVIALLLFGFTLGISKTVRLETEA